MSRDVVLSQMLANLEDCVIRRHVAILLAHVGGYLHRLGGGLDVIELIDLGNSLAGNNGDHCRCVTHCSGDKPALF